VLPYPKEDFIKNVTKLIFNFLWKKGDRINRNTVIGNVKQGGIGIVDVESKLMAIKKPNG
jgi:hypothetical protein